MTSLLVLLFRLFIIYLVIKIFWSLFSKGINIFGSKQRKPKEPIKRYESDGETIEDAEFKEVK